MNIDTKSTQNRHKMSKIDTKWAALCRFWGVIHHDVVIKFIGINYFVSVFVSGMSGQCQKYVANFEVVGIPPKLDQPPRKENGSYPHRGGAVSENSVPIFCLFPRCLVGVQSLRACFRFAPVYFARSLVRSIGTG